MRCLPGVQLREKPTNKTPLPQSEGNMMQQLCAAFPPFRNQRGVATGGATQWRSAMDYEIQSTPVRWVVMGRRGVSEPLLARVCRGAGARVCHNMRLADMEIDIPRCMELVADGAWCAIRG